MQASVVMDIGNSGLRAAFVDNAAAAPTTIPELVNVNRLSWIPNDSEGVSSPRRDRNWGKQVLADPHAQKIFREWIDALMDGARAMKSNQQSVLTWHIASVFEEAQQQMVSVIRGVRPRDCIHIVNHADIPMKTSVHEPAKLGIDRLLAAFGAVVHVGNIGPVIVVQMGTAVTVDLVNSNMIMEGGIIFTGRRLALDALHSGTSKLPAIGDPHLAEAGLDLPAKNTIAAMLSGVNHSIIGGVRYAVQRYREIADNHDIPVVVSGGDSRWLLPSLIPPVYQIDDLVLRTIALLTIAWNSQPPTSQ